jgi:hypothetical protein
MAGHFPARRGRCKAPNRAGRAVRCRLVKRSPLTPAAGISLLLLVLMTLWLGSYAYSGTHFTLTSSSTTYRFIVLKPSYLVVLTQTATSSGPQAPRLDLSLPWRIEVWPVGVPDSGRIGDGSEWRGLRGRLRWIGHEGFAGSGSWAGGPVVNWSLEQWFLPLWLPTFVLAAVLAIYLGIALRTKRITPALCACCGYDLRATPSRCPECGAVPAVK